MNSKIFMELISLDQLAGFLVQAQKNTFAAGQEKKLPDGSKISTYEKGNLGFSDNWDGSEVFQGKQLVKYIDTNAPIWGAVYSGVEYNDRKGLVDFLKSALSHPSLEMPVRGSNNYTDPEYSYFRYFNRWGGDLSHFSGEDSIFYVDEYDFGSKYRGGVLRKGPTWPIRDFQF
jgi:hypothetical protein